VVTAQLEVASGMVQAESRLDKSQRSVPFVRFAVEPVHVSTNGHSGSARRA
jgi:hypothetical protein